MKRILTESLKKTLENNKIALIIGQRQVGKTYELQRFLNQKSVQHFDFEDHSSRNLFSDISVAHLAKIFPKTSEEQEEHYLLLDEIQYLNHSGSILKLLHDHFPHLKVLATGSASFLLLKNIGDSLFGRADIYTLLPLTIREMLEKTETPFSLGEYEGLDQKPKIEALVQEAMLFGSFPAVYLTPRSEEKKKILRGYIKSLLFKDIFEIEGIRNPEVFKKLLVLLSLQIGSEINTTEISNTLGISKQTVEEYIGLYEKFQIIYRVPSFSTNPRKEISKGKKVYFVDLGLRNALIENFLPLEQRIDKGHLFENFVFNVIRGHILYFEKDWNLFFWRTYQHAEVDMVISLDGGTSLVPIEMKYAKKAKLPRSFLDEYALKIEKEKIITLENIWEWI